MRYCRVVSQQTLEPPVTTPTPKGKAKPAPKRPDRKPLDPWHVVLLDDDLHTYAYVIEMLGRVCGHPTPRAMRMAREVDTKGRVIVFTGHKELAELKREQIVGFGHDFRISGSKCGMNAVLQKSA